MIRPTLKQVDPEVERMKQEFMAKGRQVTQCKPCNTFARHFPSQKDKSSNEVQ